MEVQTLQLQDDQHLWHPCTQMKDYEKYRPIMIEQARGCYLYTTDGRMIIDAISSWWCKSLGHNHPILKMALLRQAEQFEHVMLGSTTNELIIDLSTKLTELTQTLKKISFASDGSCAVEMALKMSLHARKITGDTKRNKFVALANSYHGDTTGALSVTDTPRFRSMYENILFDCTFLTNLPYVHHQQESLWNDCEKNWQYILSQLEPIQEKITAIIIEPIVQAAGGMKIYSADFLKRLRAWTKQHHIHLIADEIMTGFGRTGKMFACEYAGIEPDMMCLGKGLTSGWLPLSATITTDEIYQLFYDDYEKGKTFYHSHTHTGNALAASVALATIDVLQSENICEHVNQRLFPSMFHAMNEIAEVTGRITNVRGIGGVVAADVIAAKDQLRLGYHVAQAATKYGALMRPLGNTIYWVPPLIANEEVIKKLAEALYLALSEIR